MFHAPMIGTFAAVDKEFLAQGLRQHGWVSTKPVQVLAANLRELRKAAGNPSQSAIAEKAGIDQKTVSRTLGASHAVGIDKLEGIAKVFKLTPWQLLVPDLDPKTPPALSMGGVESANARYLAEQIDTLTERQQELVIAVVEQLQAHGDAVSITLSVVLPGASPTSEPGTRREKLAG